MGEWSEYFEDYPGGYFGEAPYTLPVDPETQAARRRRERAAMQQAEHSAEIKALIVAHTPPTIRAIRRALARAGDARPDTIDSLGRWINENFRKDLSTMTLRRLAQQLERARFIAIETGGGGIQYLSRF